MANMLVTKKHSALIWSGFIPSLGLSPCYASAALMSMWHAWTIPIPSMPLSSLSLKGCQMWFSEGNLQWVWHAVYASTMQGHWVRSRWSQWTSQLRLEQKPFEHHTTWCPNYGAGVAVASLLKVLVLSLKLFTKSQAHRPRLTRALY